MKSKCIHFDVCKYVDMAQRYGEDDLCEHCHQFLEDVKKTESLEDLEESV